MHPTNKFSFLLVIVTLTSNALPAYSTDNTVKEKASNIFMEETFSSPQSEQEAARILYGAYASIYHSKYTQADQYILYGKYKTAAEVFRAREDSNFLLNLLNTEATKQKHATVLKTSSEFQILCAFLQSDTGYKDVGLQMLKRIALNDPHFRSIEALKTRIKAIELEMSIDPWEVPPDVVQKDGKKPDSKKWRVDKFPLKVYIPTDAACSNIKGYRAGDAQLLRSTFESWQKMGGGKIKFVFVANSNTADITCAWVNEQKSLTIDDAVGVCWQHSDQHNYMRFAEIKILTFSDSIFGHSGSDGQFRRNALTEVCLHEIGHALGMNHSTSENDIMTYHVHSKPLVMPTVRDVSTLNTLYTTNVNEMITAALESIYSNKYDAATAVLRKILTQIPKDQQTRETVCLLHTKMAKILMSREEYAPAIKHLSTAKSLLVGKESIEIKELILKSLMYCYLKTGDVKSATELEKICSMPKQEKNSVLFLDQYGIKKDSIPFYERAIADAPADFAVREKICDLLITLAQDELKDNKDNEAITLLLKAKSLLIKGMPPEAINKVMEALKKTYLYGERFREADNIKSEFTEFFPRYEKPQFNSEKHIAELVAAGKENRPSDWVKPGSNEIETKQIRAAYTRYVQALRQCAVARNVKETDAWAMTFVVRAKSYVKNEAQDPLSIMFLRRRDLVSLTDESAVISLESELPLEATKK